jgi:hypothetical protein
MGEIQLTFIVLKYKVKVYIYITEREKGADESRLCLEWATAPPQVARLRDRG